MRLILLLFLVFPTMAYTQNFWTNDQIENALQLANSGNVDQAEHLVTERGVSSYDFGLDLLALGRGNQAIIWFESLSQLNNDDHLFGLAWTLRSMGQPYQSSDLAEELIYSTDSVVKARAFYLLALLKLDRSLKDEAFVYLNESLRLYEQENRIGGINYCRDLLSKIINSSKAASTPYSTGTPPRDDEDA